MRKLLFLTLLFTAPLCSAQTSLQRLYVFGDSYSDTGRGWIDTNGPTAVGYLARDLGLDLVPSNAARLENKSLNFAVSGASTGENVGFPVEGGLLAFGMQNQVSEFATLLKAHRTSFDPDTALFFIAGGLNDSKLPIPQVVSDLETIVERLYALGARHFRITRLPEKIPGFGPNSIRLNPAIAGIPADMHAKLPDADVRLSNWGLFYDQVLDQPTQYGFTDTQNACAGRSIAHEDTTPCASPQTHFYFHKLHPSAATSKIVGDKLYAELNPTPS